MKKPLISVIVTTYNTAEYLRTCLDALIHQTLKDIEIICVDDNSTDHTLDIIQEYLKKDSRIRLLQTTQNSGISACRNLGLESAKADYIMFCDGDDYYEPTACEKMHHAITSHHTDIAINEINVIYQAHADMRVSDDNYYALRYNGLQVINENLISYTDLSPTNKIFKKSIIEQYDLTFPTGRHFEDAYFCTAYLCACQTAYYINERLYNYIRHEGSIMSQTWSTNDGPDYAIDHLYIAFELYDFLIKNHLYDKHHQLYWRLFASFESFAINNSKSRSRVKEVKAAARTFIKAHQADFNQEKINNGTICEEIIHLSSSKFYISTTRLKRIIIKFMPTYRIEVENIQRLRTLKTKNKRLLQDMQSILDKLHES